MYCPKCGNEYREGFNLCSDCGETLVFEKPFLVEDKKINAGFFKRFIAFIIDIIICSIPVSLIMYLLMPMFYFIIEKGYNPLFITLISIIVEFVPLWLYNSLLESSKYKGTLGKIILKIVVVDYNGNKISFSHSTGRFFSKLILSTALFGIGLVMVGFTKRKQGLHDIIVKTLVIKTGSEVELTNLDIHSIA